MFRHKIQHNFSYVSNSVVSAKRAISAGLNVNYSPLNSLMDPIQGFFQILLITSNLALWAFPAQFDQLLTVRLNLQLYINLRLNIVENVFSPSLQSSERSHRSRWRRQQGLSVIFQVKWSFRKKILRTLHLNSVPDQGFNSILCNSACVCVC